jgi:bifunctional enzyme CysN/CysC/sulfate adenylyltransferase subunit 1
MVLPSGVKSTVKEIWTLDGPLEEAFCPQSITLVLADDVDVSRGDMIIGLDCMPGMSAELRARICWMHPRPLTPGKKYLIKHTTSGAQAVVTSIEGRINIETLELETGAAELAVNDIGEIRLRTSRPLVYDGYNTNRLTGAFILIEPGTNATVAAGMLYPPLEAVKPEYNDFDI